MMMTDMKTDSQAEMIEIVSFEEVQPKRWQEWKIKMIVIATRIKWEKAIKEDLSKSTEDNNKRKDDDTHGSTWS